MPDLFAMIAAERRITADFLDAVDEPAAATPSLCRDWTVHDIAAHLVMPFRVSTLNLGVGMLRYRGDFDRYSRDWARGQRAEALGSLAATLRSNAEHRFTPPTLGPEAPLTDITVHTLDMRVPLGLADPETRAEPLNTVLDFLVTPKAARGFVPKGRLSGLAFETSDTGWTHGSGPLVRGPAAALLLALTGRPAGIERLEGDGVADIAGRIAA